MAKGQKGGTERLGQKGRDRTSRIRDPTHFANKSPTLEQIYLNTYIDISARILYLMVLSI